MVEVTVTVSFKGKNYITNVITSQNTDEEEIFRVAYEQVQKQWKR